MTSIRLRVLLIIFCFAAILTRGSVPAEPSSFTPEELAQGFRNGRVLIKLRDQTLDVDPGKQAAEVRIGVRNRRVFHYLKRQQILEFDRTRSVASVIQELSATGLYEFVEPDHIRKAHVTPNDPSFTSQWSLNNTGQNGGTTGADIRAVSAWDISSSAPNVIVAIIDSGMRLTHADLAANLWTNPNPGSSGYSSDFHGINATIAKSATDPSSGTPEDDLGHGTHVAGIIGAVGNNGVGISGVAWKVQLMPLKFLRADGASSTSDSITCIDYAISHNAKLINASYGGSSFSNSEFSAIQTAQASGIIFIVSAGNDSLLNDTGNEYPANYILDNIVSVAATTSSDALADYSNYGSGLVELAAPGSDIYSTLNTSDSAYGARSGTSMAAPHVTGALAMLKGRFPNDTYRQLINRLLRSVTKLSVLNGQVQSGGRLNLAAALAATDNRPFNDDFATRARLAGASVRVRSSNVGATTETGEPNHAGVGGGNSLWWTWTAPTSSLVTFETTGSSYDTVLALYSGTALNNLQLLGSNDDAPNTTTSRLTLQMSAGATCQIAVSGKNNASGLTVLRISTLPGNDDFSQAKLMTGVSTSASDTTLNASAEAGEPSHAGIAAAHSVWFKWAPPATGRYQLAAFSAQMDVHTADYTGSSVSSLTLVAANKDSIPFTDLSTPFNTDSLLSFDAVIGHLYYFAVDNTGNDGGEFTLSINDSLWQFPAGDEITSSPGSGQRWHDLFRHRFPQRVR